MYCCTSNSGESQELRSQEAEMSLWERQLVTTQEPGQKKTSWKYLATSLSNTYLTQKNFVVSRNVSVLYLPTKSLSTKSLNIEAAPASSLVNGCFEIFRTCTTCRSFSFINSPLGLWKTHAWYRSRRISLPTKTKESRFRSKSSHTINRLDTWSSFLMNNHQAA